MTSDAAPVAPAAGRLEIAPHNCFACGTLNSHGMRLDLHLEPGRCWTELVLEPRFEGWEGMAHGGIICTILDEVMAWALVEQDAWGVTARLSVEFRAPVPVGSRVRAEGEVVDARRRIFRTTGRVVAADTGDLLATGEATYVGAPDARKRELQRRYGYRLRPSGGAGLRQASEATAR